jgi:hypothetical protein
MHGGIPDYCCYMSGDKDVVVDKKVIDVAIRERRCKNRGLKQADMCRRCGATWRVKGDGKWKTKKKKNRRVNERIMLKEETMRVAFE